MFFLQGVYLEQVYELGSAEDADMIPPRDCPISLGAYFLIFRMLTLINILTKLFALQKGG